VSAKILSIGIPVKILGIDNPVSGRKASLLLVNSGGRGGTMCISSDVVLENLSISNQKDSGDDDDDEEEEEYFPTIEVCGGGRLVMINCNVKACAGTACILDDKARAHIESCTLSSVIDGYPMFLGVVAQNGSSVSIDDCDLRRNQWGCFLGKNLTAEGESVIRRRNHLQAGEGGVTRMYDCVSVAVNPWVT